MQGTAGLVCAPGVPQPEQFHSHHPWDIIIGPGDIFLAAAGREIPKGLCSWGYQN